MLLGGLEVGDGVLEVAVVDGGKEQLADLADPLAFLLEGLEVEQHGLAELLSNDRLADLLALLAQLLEQVSDGVVADLDAMHLAEPVGDLARRPVVGALLEHV